MLLPEFWRDMNEKANFQGRRTFPNACKLAELILSLPHSNADAERIFSILKDVKTAKRNRLSDETLNALLTFRSATRNIAAEDFVVPN